VRPASPSISGDPHRGGPVLTAGPPAGAAPAAIILAHGRGGSAEDMLRLARELDRPDLTCLAPQAAGASWYPSSFLAPFAQNEPALTSALMALGRLLDELASAGVPPESTVLAGFSQGACLVLEFVARNPRRYGGVAGLSGGLIGPPGAPRDYPGSLSGTPIFLGCSDRDPHIPLFRVDETAHVLAALDAVVDRRIYPAMGHTVNADEIAALRGLVAALGGATAG
jgi:predicted esterase